MILKFWKLIIAGFVVLGASLRKLLPGKFRKKKEELAPVVASDIYDTTPGPVAEKPGTDNETPA